MTVYTCDACGEEISGATEENEVETASGVWDICDRCLDRLIDILDNTQWKTDAEEKTTGAAE
jgi:hypothetical protein